MKDAPPEKKKLKDHSRRNRNHPLSPVQRRKRRQESAEHRRAEHVQEEEPDGA